MWNLMRDLSCDVIRDLLPAVADEIASADTEALVKEHIEQCAACRAALDAMRAPETAPKTHKLKTNKS